MAGKPQTLSSGQQDEVISILRSQILKWTLIAIAIFTGITGLSVWGIKTKVENKVETLVAKQFEEPRIKEIVKGVAANRADTLMSEQIRPEVEKFKIEIATRLNELEALGERIRGLESMVTETAKLAGPPTLTLSGREMQKGPSGYKITLQFTPSKNEPLGTIVFVASVADNSDIRILDFWPKGTFTSGKDSKKISEDGKQARLAYGLLSAGRATFEITLSAPGKISIEGNYLSEAILIEPEESAEPSAREGRGKKSRRAPHP